MPRVALTEKQRRSNRAERSAKDLENMIRKQMREQHITQQACGSEIGITSQQGYSYNLKNMSFNIRQLFILCDLLGISISIKEKEREL